MQLATYWMITMKLFKRPEDKHTEEEYNEMRKKVQDMNLSRKEEWIIIWQAIKTFLPGFILAIIGVYSLVILFALLVL